MADNTSRFGLNTYSDGDTNWTHNDVVQQVDELAIARGEIADRPTSGDYDGELYFAEDDLTLFKWDANSTSWGAVAGLGTDGSPLPQLSVEQDSLTVGGTTVENLFADAGHEHSGETINPDVTNADEFTLPSGWSLTENNSGEVVIENSGGSEILRWNESESEWVTDGLNATNLTASGSITDPDGNTVTSLSDPVRVTEDAVTFTESDVTVTTNSTRVLNESLGLTRADVIDDFEDGDITVKSANYTGWNGDTGSLSAQQSTVIGGSFSGEFTSSNEDIKISVTRDTNKAIDTISFKTIIDNQSSNFLDRVRFQFPGNSSGEIARVRFRGDDGAATVNGTTILSSWDINKTYDVTLSNIDYSSETLDADINGTTVTDIGFNNSNSSIAGFEIVNTTNNAGITRNVYIDALLEGENATSGDALIEWDSGVPAEIDSWDLATFQESEDGETVKVDAEEYIPPTLGTTATVEDSNDTGSVEAKRGYIINPNTTLDGVKAKIYDAVDGITTAYLQQNSDGTELDRVSASGGDTVKLSASLNAGTEYRLVVDAGGNTYTDARYTSPSYPYESNDIDITSFVSDGTTDTLVTLNFKSVTAITSAEVKDNTILDIGRNFDISTIDTSKNVKLRANLSRNDTANNPTLDFAARRFTR